MTAVTKHRPLPDSVNHPWKGADLPQVVHSYYRADGASSGDWVPYVVGQVYFKGSSQMVAPVAYTRVAPTFTASGFALSTVENTGGYMTFNGVEAAVVVVDWSIVLYQDDASEQQVAVLLAPIGAVTGYEHLEQKDIVQPSGLATFSGQYIDRLSQGATFGIWVNVGSGDIFVEQARISMHSAF